MNAYRLEPGATYGKLLYKGGAAKVTLKTDPHLSDLARGEFEGPKRPTVTERDGTIEVKWPRVWPWHWNKIRSSMALREDVPWTIEFRGGVSEIRGDLGQATLRAVDIVGGASDVELHLGRPQGVCAVRVAGGVSQFTLRRPAGVGVRVRIKGGASDLSLDTFRFEAVGGQLRWESHGFPEADAAYDLEIVGGASQIRIAIA
jgi:hypothetical protein